MTANTWPARAGRNAPDTARVPPTARALRAGIVLLAVGLVAACQSTTGSNLRVRAEPTTQSRIIAVMPRTGTSVQISCQTGGEPVHGDPTWYRITSPHPGYVSGHYIRTNRTPPPTC